MNPYQMIHDARVVACTIDEITEILSRRIRKMVNPNSRHMVIDHCSAMVWNQVEDEVTARLKEPLQRTIQRMGS